MNRGENGELPSTQGIGLAALKPIHHAILHYCISNRFFHRGDLDLVYNDLHRVAGCGLSLDEILEELNEALSGLDLRIKKGRDPFDYEFCYSMVNLCSDEVMVNATHYSPAEILFFKKMLDMIAANKHGNYGVPMLSVLQETSRDKSTPSKKTTEGLIERLSSDGWLAERNGIVSLGVRSILELDGYFRLEFPNIIFDCLLCHDIIVSPYEICSSCSARVHTYCAEDYAKDTLSNKCVSCGSNITLSTRKRARAQEGSEY